MATSRLIALHVRKGRSASRSMKDRLDYAQNPEKTEGGELVSSYECDPRTAWAEFMLSHREYHLVSGQDRAWGVLAYQIRQSFKPGEVEPAEANKIGFELGMRFTKGKHAFTVSTHTDRKHIHNHIVFNAVTLDGDKKFRNFFLSGRAVQHLSDIICLEHGLSVLDRKQKKDWGKKAYDSNIKRPDKKLSLMLDMEKIMREGKGVAYQKWAEHFNATQGAKAMLFIEDHGIRSMQELTELADGATARFNELSQKIKKSEARLKEISETKRAIIDYVKTKDVYTEYRKAGYSKKFLEKHRQEILLHKAAKKKFDEIGMKTLPRIKDLTEEYENILSEKKEAYKEYRETRTNMKNYAIAKKNAEMLLATRSVPARNAQPSRDA